MRKKNNITHTLALAGLWILTATACTDETGLTNNSETSYEVRFTATLQAENQLQTRAIFDNEKGEVETLPFINKISIRKIHSSSSEVDAQTVTPYNVMTANKGVLTFEGKATNSLKWDNDHLDDNVDFYAWTAPTGVTIAEGDELGEIDFVKGNKKPSNEGTTTQDGEGNDKNKLDGNEVTPLEVFISAMSTDNNYHVSPSVTLPFTHPVSKVSIYLRNWDNQHITNGDGISIEFLSIPQKWTIEQTTNGDSKSAFYVKEPSTGTKADETNADLTLSFSGLEYANGYFTMYLPPLTQELGTDFATGGDFCITYSDNQYYGTLGSITNLKELQAGQHMALQMDLSKNYGVGVGAYIHPWQGPDKEELIGVNPHKGIYSTEGFKQLVEYLKSEENILADTLYIKENDQKTVRLYNDLTITEAQASDLLGATLKGITFDGQGHTITLPAGSKGLFDAIGDADGTPTTTIKNLYLAVAAPETVTANGLLANTATNVTIENCHTLSGSIAPTTGMAGGLIGTANTGTKLSFCSSVIRVTSPDNSAGGLIGEVTSGATDVTITGCYAQCPVTASSSSNAGGLVGNMAAGTMTYSFFCFGNSASIAGGTNPGIFAGNTGTNGGSIENCYWGITNGSTTSLSPIGGSGSTESSPTSNYAFLIQKLTQEEGEGENKHSATYQAGTLGSFEGEDKALFKAATGSDNNILMLLDALHTGTNSESTGKDWVWVYGKDYPVVRIK